MIDIANLIVSSLILAILLLLIIGGAIRGRAKRAAIAKLAQGSGSDLGTNLAQAMAARRAERQQSNEGKTPYTESGG